MNKIYIVIADFSSYDEVSIHTLGVFNSLDKANKCKIKWETFFKDKYKEIFEPIKRDEYDDHTDEYYILMSKYSDIANFNEININEYTLNYCEYVKFEYHSDDMKDLLK